MGAENFSTEIHNSNRPKFAGRPEEKFLIGSGIATVLMTLYLLVVKYSIFRHLDSACNRRLLGAVKAWLDHGFWKLGGFLYFEDTYSGAFPDKLYRSQAPFYLLPHYLATSLGGEQAFWLVTGLVPIVMAIFISLALAYIAWIAVDSIAKWQKWASIRGANLVAAVSAFSVTFTSEPIWSLTWNTFDGSWAVVFWVAAVVVAMISSKPDLGLGRWLPTGMLVIGALICPRFGFVIVLSQLLIRFIGSRKLAIVNARPYNCLFGWPAIGLVFFASLTHFLRLAVAIHWQGLRFRGSEILPRMGLTGWWENAAQGKLHYLSPLDAFTFLWRQSGTVINKLPLWISIHHLVIWSIAILVFAALFAERRYYSARPLLEFLFFPSLLWMLVHNQSAAEHPDMYAIFWLPSYALGLAFLLTRLYGFLRQRCRREHAYVYTSFAIWLFFLWQNQYFMRAYPEL